MNKCVIPVPADVRYISDWAEKEDGYRLENYLFRHIVDKQLTGCGYTEYCLRNSLNIILCSPRRMLLENKAEQHWREPNVMYFRNDLEKYINPESLEYDSEIRESSGESVKAESIITTITKTKRQEKTLADAKEGVLKLKKEFADNFMNIYCPVKTGYKILVTYDSFRHVKEVLTDLGVFNSFYVVVDEFQSIFIDSKFKSEAELELLYDLRDVNNLCFVSATPMLDKYLEMLDDFKDLPYYEFDWAAESPMRVMKPEIEPVTCNSISKELGDVISDYLNGNFEVASYLDKNGNLVEVESKEAVFYVNSVKHICNLIKSNKLTPENTNVLCARTPENEKKVRQAFKSVIGNRVSDFKTLIGTVPMFGEPHKMFTLCTRTVYLGADFYSTNARSFIASDANLDSLSVDISLDLPQILGRQRLDINPWKNRAVIFIKTITGDRIEDAKQFNERIEKKKRRSDSLLNIYYTELANSDPFTREALAEKYQSDAQSGHYSNDYVAVNKHAKSGLLPVMNTLVMIADIRTFEIQQMDYRDRAAVLNAVEADDKVVIVDVEEKVKKFYELSKFKDRMLLVCNTGFDDINQQYFLRQIPIAFGNFYNTLGPERIKNLLSHNASVKSEYEKLKQKQTTDVKSKVISSFNVGSTISLVNIKNTLREIYAASDYKKTAKATDLLEYFECKECSIPKVEDPKKRDRAYKILSIKS